MQKRRAVLVVAWVLVVGAGLILIGSSRERIAQHMGVFDGDVVPPKLSEPPGADLGITPANLWHGMHSGCGRWTPCLDIGHFAEDEACVAEGNCGLSRGDKLCFGAECFDRGNNGTQRVGEYHSIGSKDGPGNLSYWLTSTGHLSAIEAFISAGNSASRNDYPAKVAFVARIANAAVPDWQELPTWAGEMFLALGSLGGNFPQWEAQHPTPPGVELAYQRVRAAALAGFPASGADRAIVEPWMEEYGKRLDQYMKTCDGKAPPPECERSVSDHGVRATLRRSGMGLVQLSIEPLSVIAEQQVAVLKRSPDNETGQKSVGTAFDSVHSDTGWPSAGDESGRIGKAKSISIAMKSVGDLRDGALTIRLTVSNLGDDVAQSVTPALYFRGQERRGKGMQSLAPQQSFEETLSLPTPELTAGRWPYWLTLNYTDRNQYPFQALHAAVLTVGNPESPKVVAREMPNLTVSSRGILTLNLKNASGATHNAKIHVLVPEGLEVSTPPPPPTLAGWEERALSVPLVNRTALAGSKLPVFATVEYDDGDAHQAVVARAVVEIVAPESSPSGVSDAKRAEAEGRAKRGRTADGSADTQARDDESVRRVEAMNTAVDCGAPETVAGGMTKSADTWHVNFTTQMNAPLDRVFDAFQHPERTHEFVPAKVVKSTIEKGEGNTKVVDVIEQLDTLPPGFKVQNLRTEYTVYSAEHRITSHTIDFKLADMGSEYRFERAPGGGTTIRFTQTSKQKLSLPSEAVEKGVLCETYLTQLHAVEGALGLAGTPNERQKDSGRLSLEPRRGTSRSPAYKPWVYDHRNEECNRIPDAKIDRVLEMIEHEHGPCDDMLKGGDGKSAILWCQHGVKVALGQSQNDCRKARLVLEDFLKANGQCNLKPGQLRCEN